MASFQFIDSSTVQNPKVRRSIRSHVMRGKNKRGQNRQRQTQCPTPRVSTLLPYADPLSKAGDDTGDDDGDETTCQELAPAKQGHSDLVLFDAQQTPICRPSNFYAGREHGYFAFRDIISPEMRYLLHDFNEIVVKEVYPHEFCRRPDQAKMDYLEYLVSSRTFLYAMFATASTYISAIRGPNHRSLSTTLTQHWYLGRALEFLRADLSSSSSPPFSHIGVMISLAIQANALGNLENARVHMRALQFMINNRPGGFSALRLHRLQLFQKICRTDILISMGEGSPTSLCQSDQFTMSADAAFLPVRSRTADGTRHSVGRVFPVKGLCEPLRTVAKNIQTLCSWPSAVSKLTGFQFQDAIISVAQRLVNFAPLNGPRPPVPLDDIVHLGLLSFITMLLYPSHPLRVERVVKLQNMLAQRLNDGRCREVLIGREDLHLWLLFSYACSVPEIDPEDRILSLLVPVTRALDLHSWDDAKQQLHRFPWVAREHDALGMKIWNRTRTQDPQEAFGPKGALEDSTGLPDP